MFTVKQLIDALSEWDEDAVVLTQISDMYGTVSIEDFTLKNGPVEFVPWPNHPVLNHTIELRFY